MCGDVYLQLFGLNLIPNQAQTLWRIFGPCFSSLTLTVDPLNEPGGVLLRQIWASVSARSWTSYERAKITMLAIEAIANVSLLINVTYCVSCGRGASQQSPRLLLLLNPMQPQAKREKILVQVQAWRWWNWLVKILRGLWWKMVGLLSNMVWHSSSPLQRPQLCCAVLEAMLGLGKSSMFGPYMLH